MMTRTIANLKIYQHPNVQAAIKSKELFVRARDGIICQCGEPGLQIFSPWLFEGNIGTHPCIWCHKVLFTLFALMPSPALDCWKVVVRPRTIVELIRLNELQTKRQKREPCKCGIEPREDVPANYGGYWYTRSFQDGLEMKRKVRKLITRKISSDIPVYLKRGCTGIELMFGPSDRWKIAEGQAFLEHRLANIFHRSFRENRETRQPIKLKEEILETWLYFAHSRGDMSYLEITNGRYLFPPAIIYNKDSTFLS